MENNFFDRTIDRMSASALKKKVWAVIAVGLALCFIAAAAASWLLTRNFFIADRPGLSSVKFIDLLKSK